jgi:hypothetical protein
MAVWTLFFSSVLLPLVTIALLALRPRRPWANWGATVFMALGVCSFSVLAAPWGWFGFPLRWAILVLFFVALAISLWRTSGPGSDDSIVRIVVKVFIGLMFGSVAVGIIQAHRVPPAPFDLAFPFKEGRFLVLHGGATTAANAHAVDPKTKYGVDFVKVSPLGFRAAGIYPADLTRYKVYDAEVISPCSGRVISVVDGLPDQARGMFDEKNSLGNLVTIQCGNVDVTLAQLRPHQLKVKLGSNVGVGTPIGRVGNSGMTTEPHLHVHAERYGTPVPITFDKEWMVRNTLVSRRTQ